MALDYTVAKYCPDGLLASSAGRGWSSLSAVLRSHEHGVIAGDGPLPGVEICADLHGSGAMVTQLSGGIASRTIAERGTIWLKPAGLRRYVVELADRLPRMLHISLSPECFAPAALGSELDPSLTSSLRCHGGFQDPLLAGIAEAIAAELQNETAGGRVLVEALAISMAARLAQMHREAVPCPLRSAIAAGLDRRRLARVLDFIEDNLEEPLTLEGLAQIACLSRFHFARSFKVSTGQSPHRYVSSRRLERAKALLVAGERALADVALSLGFSCQANFTRAFRDATGRTPGQYRRAIPD